MDGFFSSKHRTKLPSISSYSRLPKLSNKDAFELRRKYPDSERWSDLKFMPRNSSKTGDHEGNPVDIRRKTNSPVDVLPHVVPVCEHKEQTKLPRLKLTTKKTRNIVNIKNNVFDVTLPPKSLSYGGFKGILRETSNVTTVSKRKKLAMRVYSDSSRPIDLEELRYLLRPHKQGQKARSTNSIGNMATRELETKLPSISAPSGKSEANSFAWRTPWHHSYFGVNRHKFKERTANQHFLSNPEFDVGLMHLSLPLKNNATFSAESKNTPLKKKSLPTEETEADNMRNNEFHTQSKTLLPGFFAPPAKKKARKLLTHTMQFLNQRLFQTVFKPVFYTTRKQNDKPDNIVSNNLDIQEHMAVSASSSYATAEECGDRNNWCSSATNNTEKNTGPETLGANLFQTLETERSFRKSKNFLPHVLSNDNNNYKLNKKKSCNTTSSTKKGHHNQKRNILPPLMEHVNRRKDSQDADDEEDTTNDRHEIWDGNSFNDLNNVDQIFEDTLDCPTKSPHFEMKLEYKNFARSKRRKHQKEKNDGVLSPNDSETNLQLNKSLRKKPRKLKKTKTDGSEVKLATLSMKSLVSSDGDDELEENDVID
ncbi:uncharacterized protein LOC143446286 isoform X2 [Clavelina lepadiformis]|uniref:uncharacterized protein LOC143446286 isoform X2 n=1 Tax=Clavelina lepadiformis TaxID=159417 RepID=UPI004042F8D4